jgi:hypothetical protein
MKVSENEGGGLTIELRVGDRLADVPPTHIELLSPEVRRMFADVPGEFRRIADAAPVPAMREWLGRLIDEGDWRLQLHRAGHPDFHQAGIDWASDTVRGAEIGPAVEVVSFSGPVGELFRLIGYLDWMGFGTDGRLHPPVPVLNVRSGWIESGPRIDMTRTVAWGSNNGKCLLASPPDFAGWITMSGDVKPLGTVAEAMEHVFRRLLNNQNPAEG